MLYYTGLLPFVPLQERFFEMGFITGPFDRYIQVTAARRYDLMVVVF